MLKFNALITVIYWVSIYFIPVQFAYAIGIIATFQLIYALYLRILEKRAREKQIAKVLDFMKDVL